ncbi:DUF6908 domain-containing protein [Leptolyngbya sp. KIOST-1]|uniref:DUF6908 domain-containing protein n=1 Tax=Leptolyngbya sp. KIOST-1 TaxID=1229172 RepID=UPI000569979E
MVERQGDELYLTHYLTQNGDMFIDSEMVFRVRGEGHIEFKETAVQIARGGESRLPDGHRTGPKGHRVLLRSSPKTLFSKGSRKPPKLSFRPRQSPKCPRKNRRISDSISGPLFMDWLADAGGWGAIALVMRVPECCVCAPQPASAILAAGEGFGGQLARYLGREQPLSWVSARLGP